MADILCGYTADRDETLIAYVYGEIDPVQHAAFDAHIATCERCRKELADLRGVRGRLQEWTAPGATGSIAHAVAPAVPDAASVTRASTWTMLREIPAWAQVAAALLVLGISAGIANLDVRYDRSALTIHTGWSRPSPRAESDSIGPAVQPIRAPAAAVPWRTDLDALERRLRTEFHGGTAAGATPALSARDAGSASADAQLLRRVRALIDDSERRQQNELALRIADVVREFDSKRGSDLVNIDRTLRAMQSNTGVEVLKQQQQINYLYRAAVQK